jgi:sulfur-oxidizing protein SoxY
MLRRSVLSLASFLCLSPPAIAGSAWDEVRPALFGDRQVEDGAGLIELISPYRATDDRQVPIAIKTHLPNGTTVKSATFVIDENPMPVSAAVHFDKPVSTVSVGANFRLNDPSPVHLVVEASGGKLCGAEAYVKTSGLGACASPPVRDPEEALASLGDIDIQDMTDTGNGTATQVERRARLSVMHPNHTGLQMNQITLHDILPRYIDRIAVKQGNEKLFHMEAGISLSEDPQIDFAFRLNGVADIDVGVRDTDKAEFSKSFPVQPQS